MRLFVLFVAITGVIAVSQTQAAEQPSPVPRFASLSRDQVYMREGPTYRHRVLWVYHRKGLPVQIVAQFDVWRRIRDADGTTGWVHSSMISETRTVVVTSKKPAPVYRGGDPRSQILALAEPGVIAKLETCTAALCEINAEGTEGWIEKKNVWGVKPGEFLR